jgi:alpha-L-fucosidase 2
MIKPYRYGTLFVFLGILLMNSACSTRSYDPLPALAKYDVTWDSPSRDAWGTMPTGNGDIGLNVWVEESGDLLFYIGKTDLWDDNSRLLKLGRVRFRINPNPYLMSGRFLQTLRLRDATVEVRLGEGEDMVSAQVWVDALHPVIHVLVEGRRPLEVNAGIEVWRTTPYELPSIEVSDVPFDHDVPGNQHFPTIVEPDTILTGLEGRIGWYHHNTKSVGPALSAGLQDMQGFNQPDPILHRTFGAVITAESAKRVDDLNLLSGGRQSHYFEIYVLTKHPSTPQEWLKSLDESIASLAKIPLAQRLEAHRSWWKEFWSRSWIDIASAAPDDDTYILTRAYALQRFINACAGRGAYPIKFNGSIFTVPNPGSPGDADYRRWGPGYWWQNTRLPYMSMCTSGDFDLLEPLYRMYTGDVLEMAKYRTQRYFGHAGAYLNECVYFWGAAFNESYGWTPREKRTVVENESRWHRWEWQGGLELLHMMLDHYEHTLDEALLRERLLPLAHEILTFYDLHYPVDGSGKIVMEPAQALETWWDCRNPMPEIAGILGATERLAELAGDKVEAAEKALWERMQAKMPDLPTQEVEGRRMLAPAEKFATKSNIENPELYAVFPYRRVALGRPGIKLAIEALNHRLDRGNFGWRQEDIFMAYLGLTDQARDYVVGRARAKHEGSRFPAFWGPNYDWVPDQDHGGVLLKALQAMLMQTDGRKIMLLPAWPKDWEVDFKLHAPYRTVVSGHVKQGKVTKLSVKPADRRKDISFMSHNLY